MTKMKVNGQEICLIDEITLLKYLEDNSYNILRIAVEKNGDIVPKANYENVILNNNDTIEIVSFVGGGW